MKVFVDTNILIRATVNSYPLHAEAKDLLIRYKQSSESLWISRQVIREYIAQLTRGQGVVQPLTAALAAQMAGTLESLFEVADDTAPVTKALIELIREFPTGGRQIHDANIVATMLVHGITTLLTLNIADMRRFSNKITLISLISEE